MIRPDVVVQGGDGFPVLVVEVKNRENFPREVASALRQAFLDHGLGNTAAYFMLLSQDVGYLWQQADVSANAHLPHEFSTRNLLRRYLPDAGSPARLGGAQLELVVTQWLRDLAEHGSHAQEEPERTLATTGLLAAIEGATVLSEAFV